MTLTTKRSTIAGICICILLGGIGLSMHSCNSNNSQFSPAQQQTLDRLHSIVAYSGGDWDKVKPADQQLFIQGPGSGNEGSAKIVFGTMAAQMKTK